MTWLRIAAAVVVRPRLWPTAVRQMQRTAAPGWWRHAPFIPVPSGGYMKFRLVTQYGDASHRPNVDDVVAYLSWCRRWDRLRH
jgi:hypothetical protein